MKILALFLLLGLAAFVTAAPVEDDLETELTLLEIDLADLFFNVRDESQAGPILTKLRERFQRIYNRMKESFEEGNTLQPKFLKKAKDLFEKLKGMGGLTEKMKKMFEELKAKFGGYGPVPSDDMYDKFRKLKSLILDGASEEELQAQVEDIFGAGSEMAEQLIGMLKEKGDNGEQRVLNWIERILDEENQEEKRSIKDVFEKVKNYFKDLNIELKEKFTKFGEWVKNQYEKALEKGKGKIDNVKRIAKEFLEDSKQISKDVAEEALEFFREYKEDLGKVFEDIKEKVKKTLKESHSPMASDDMYDKFRKLKSLILDGASEEELKAQVEDMFGAGSEMAEQLIGMLKEKGDNGEQRVLNWIERILDEENQEEKRSIKDIFEKVKNYFKDLNIELKEKFTKFGEWVKNQYEKALEKGKGKIDNVKRIAKEFLEDSKQISKDVAEEALEFFREYKEDLGKVFEDIKEKVKKTLKE